MDKEWAPKEEIREWSEDPVTISLRGRLRVLLSDQQVRLVSLCRQSSDPTITKAVGHFDAIASMLELTDADDAS